MKKFGFDGRLGKDGQGIAQPIAVKVFHLLITLVFLETTRRFRFRCKWI